MTEWRKSSHSGGGSSSGDCVELADLGPTVGVRDSRDPEGPRLELDGPGFTTLINTVRTHTPA
ncbi:DUF397 domain-containing protein [Actinomadura harenae]|uniref:DUF397 domain-containing protein n=1 Tax=Actinomadura harenae TaxID=2483351 RepID=A0A3M2M8W8_9ACTN|nr:DUF397 domain-containing protein [Actinomadura harenae]RMI45929.1 DUF397 domain-containing protein [Actinomadura harenae]